MGNYNFTNQTAMTPAERQKKYRKEMKNAGMVFIQVPVSKEERETLKKCFAEVGGDHWTLFLRKSLLKGAVFSHNSGSSLKMKLVKGLYVQSQMRTPSSCNELNRLCDSAVRSNKEARGNS